MRTTITENVIFEIADTLGVNPLEMEPLGEVIDTDALNVITQSGNAEVSFEYNGCHVTVRGLNEIELTPK